MDTQKEKSLGLNGYSPDDHALQLMTASEAARLLMVTPRKVYRMMKDGEIPTVKFGGSVRIRKIDLEKFILDHLQN